jgi:hypothetical protein
MGARWAASTPAHGATLTTAVMSGAVRLLILGTIAATTQARAATAGAARACVPSHEAGEWLGEGSNLVWRDADAACWWPVANRTDTLLMLTDLALGLAWDAGEDGGLALLPTSEGTGVDHGGPFGRGSSVQRAAARADAMHVNNASAAGLLPSSSGPLVWLTFMGDSLSRQAHYMFLQLLWGCTGTPTDAEYSDAPLAGVSEAQRRDACGDWKRRMPISEHRLTYVSVSLPRLTTAATGSSAGAAELLPPYRRRGRDWLARRDAAHDLAARLQGRILTLAVEFVWVRYASEFFSPERQPPVGGNYSEKTIPLLARARQFGRDAGNAAVAAAVGRVLGPAVGGPLAPRHIMILGIGFWHLRHFREGRSPEWEANYAVMENEQLGRLLYNASLQGVDAAFAQSEALGGLPDNSTDETRTRLRARAHAAALAVLHRSVVWRCMPRIEKTDIGNAFHNYGIGNLSARMLPPWRDANYTVVDPARLVAGLPPVEPAPPYRLTMDGLHPLTSVQLHIVYEVLSAAWLLGPSVEAVSVMPEQYC